MANRTATVPSARFVTAWQGSKDIHEVVKKTGMKLDSAMYRARLYRRKGVKLKKFPARYGEHLKLDVEALNKLVGETGEAIANNDITKAQAKSKKVVKAAKKIAAKKRVRKPAKKRVRNRKPKKVVKRSRKK